MINNTVLVGRLTKDPELRYTPSGVAVARFTLAVNRPFANASGEREADFISCVVWRKPAENVANFLKKGSLAGVVGRIQTGSYEQEGKRVYTTDVVAETVQFLEPKNAGAGTGGGASTAPTPPAETSGGSPQGEPNPFEGQPIEVSDDDLPF